WRSPARCACRSTRSRRMSATFTGSSAPPTAAMPYAERASFSCSDRARAVQRSATLTTIGRGRLTPTRPTIKATGKKPRRIAMTSATIERTDEQIQNDIYEELRWDARVQPNEVGVAVNDGVVTLTGWVDNYTKKWIAERASHRVRGVVAVANDVEVR